MSAFPELPSEPLRLAAGDVRVFDFGPDGVGGYAVFDVAAFSGAPVLRLSYATHPDGLGDKGDFWRETRATYLGDDVDLPILPASVDRFDLFAIDHAGPYAAPLQQGLLRYLRVALEGEGTATVAGLRIENRGTHAEDSPAGTFDCSDARLSAIWRAGVRTCQLAAIPAREKPLHVVAPGVDTVLAPTLPYLSDGAKRDRLVWSGDLWWAAPTMYYAFGPQAPYMAGSIRMLAANQTPEGYVQACPWPERRPPPGAGEWGPFGSDEFAAWLVPVVYDHWRHTGDRALLAEVLPALGRLMDYLGRHCRPDGLFEQRRETSKNAGDLRFGDHSCDHRAYMNVLLLGCHRMMEELLRASSPGAAARHAACADRLAAAIEARFALPGGGLAKSLEEPSFSPEATALRHALHGCAPGPYPRARYAPIWHAKFQAALIRALFAGGFADAAVQAVFDHNWAKVVDPAWPGLRTTYECMHLHTKGWGDEAHPDTALSGIFSRHILGVAPAAPGFASFTFEPPRMASVTRAAGRVPTPFGPIDASWERRGDACDVEIDVPGGTSGSLLFDGLARPLAPGPNRLRLPAAPA